MRVAELLGFDAVVVSTHHAIGAGDNFTDLAFAIQSLCIGLSRVTHDLLNRATAESGALHVHDSFVQISSIMPQKRNPVVLEHLPRPSQPGHRLRPDRRDAVPQHPLWRHPGHRR